MAAEDQGIMSLPMEGEAASQNMPQMPLGESYDAVKQGLENASPQAAADVQQLMASITPQLDQLSDEELAAFLQAVQYLYEGGEAQYAKRLQEAISSGMLDAGDLPEDYDPELLSAIGTVLLQAMQQRQGATPAPAMEPPVQQFARGGIAEAARMVASKGRNGDTMLAHITPDEARLLKKRGGSGTINPETGLPEFFLKKIAKAVKGVVKGVVGAVKSIVKSPIGRILATVALATFLGPAGASIGGGLFSAGTATALASGAVTALGGGDLKQVLTSAATAYFGAPGGVVSQYVGAAGITNVAANAAITSGIVGTGAGLLTGQKLSDAVKSGLTAGAIGGLTTGIQRGFDTQMVPLREPAPVTDYSRPAEALTPADVAAGAQASVSPAAAPAAVPAPVAPPAGGTTYDSFGNVVPVGSPAAASFDPTGLAGPVGTSAPVSMAGPLQLPPGAAPEPGYTVAGAPPVAARVPTSGPLQLPPGAAPEAGYTVAGAPGAQAPTAPPPAGESFMRMAGGIGDLVQNKPGAFDTFKQGASDFFMPKTYTAAELQTTPVFESARASGASYTEAIKQAQAAYNPSLVRQYAPMAAAGMGIAGMMGGFEPSKVPPSAMAQQMRGTPGLDLINRNPSQYLVQGLPGVQYSQQGNITGTSSWSPTVGMNDVQVATPNYARYNYSPYSRNYFAAADGGLASLAKGGYPRKTGAISGPGTETSDSIPAMLSDGEFVMTAKAVKGIGGGSRRAGAKKMYALMHQLERNASRG